MLIAETREDIFLLGKLGRFEGYNRCFGFGNRTFSLDGVDYSPSIERAEHWGEGRVLRSLAGIFVGGCITKNEFQSLFLLLKFVVVVVVG